MSAPALFDVNVYARIPTETWVLPRPRLDRPLPDGGYNKGGFPLHFEQKLWRVLGCPAKVLHPFGGRAEIGTRST